MKGHKLTIILLFLALILIYAFSSQGTTQFDYFTRLADSFIQGKYWIEEAPSWLTELIPAGTNKFYVVYPPMPAIVSILPRLIFKNFFEQQFLAHIMGAGIAVTFYLLTLKLTNSFKKAIWIYLLVGLGNIIWFLSAVGSSWYLGQISAAFFLTLALYNALTKRQPFIIGLFLGAAYLSRLHTILSIPFFLYILYQKNWFSNYFKLGLGILPFILFNFIYNYLRFGTVLDQAYFILPMVLNEQNAPWFINGVANPIYIPNNLKAMFWSFPKRVDYFPYILPSWAGLSIWITTPAFIYAFFSNLRERIVRYSYIAILLIFLIVASHGGTGWAQFGYRFAVDFYPFLIFLVIKGISNKDLSWHHWFLLIISILVNLWGVLWINKFGWVTF